MRGLPGSRRSSRPQDRDGREPVAMPAMLLEAAGRVSAMLSAYRLPVNSAFVSTQIVSR